MRARPHCSRRATPHLAAKDLRVRYAKSVVDLVGNTPLVRLNAADRGAAAAGAGQGRVLQPGRLGEGPDRAAR